MAHFITLVLVPGKFGKKKMLGSKKQKAELEEAVMDLIYAYASYFPAIDYQVPCYCLPIELKTAVVEEANQEVGEFWELYKTFLEIPEKSRPDWSDFDPFNQWVRTCHEETMRSEQFQERNPNCEYCDGTGFMATNENYSRYEYDYFNIADLDPAVDPNLITEYFFEVNKLASLDIDYEAIVTPDGQWHSIIWGGDSADPVSDWQERSQLILDQYPDHFVFKSHMHI